MCVSFDLILFKGDISEVCLNSLMENYYWVCSFKVIGMPHAQHFFFFWGGVMNAHLSNNFV